MQRIWIVAGCALGLAASSGSCAAARKPTTRSASHSRPGIRSASAARKRPLARPKAAGPARSILSAGARGPSTGIEKAALEIPDLKTNEGVSTVVTALQSLPGVRSAVIDLNTHLAVVDYDPALTEPDRFLGACRDAGYTASEYRVESRFPKPIKLKGG